MKKLISFTVLASMAIAITSCNTSNKNVSNNNPIISETESNKIIKLPNSIVKYETLEEAIEACGFKFSIPDTIVGYENKKYSIINDETIQITYYNEKKLESINEEDKSIGAEELLDLFINGSISAISSEDSAFYITDLDMDSGEWDSYSIGERVDLDNDGENELIICGPYGGIYLDVRNNKVYEFAVGEGDSLVLSYVFYNGSTWIMYSNRMHTGYEAYHMEKFEGADNLVAEMNFHEELVDEDNVEGEEKYTLNGTEISYDEYFELCSKIFATEVTTTK